MKISYNWLKDYLDLKETPEEVSKVLTAIGLEVESLEHIESVKGGLQGVVVGKVLTCDKHPEADRLSLTTVNVGTGTPLQIVCGAPNVAAGQTVAVATVGTTLYFSSGEEIKIKKSKIRGVESFGMICAEDELGLGNSHEGIIVLDSSLIAGSPLSEHVDLKDDYVFEIGLTPNRIDAACHLGTARDLAAYYRRKVELPSVDTFTVDNTKRTIPVVVEQTDACIRYTGVTITGVTIKESPAWLKDRLKMIGLNPKNNVVDITNYVLHELGQPLHSFDADRIKGNKVVVRTCPEGTNFVSLDGLNRKLHANDLMICDAQDPMCIGGVLGGIDSGVSDNTTNVFLEAACFNPVWIRKSSRRHAIFTDASFRFERGVDPNLQVYALKRAALLIKELAGGEISSEIIDIYPKVILPYSVEISFSNIRRVVGKNIPDDTIHDILKALEIQIESVDGDKAMVSVPTYRVDVRRECDIIEDVLRIYGYNNVEIPLQVKSTLSYTSKPEKDTLVNILADYLSNNQFNEIMSNSLSKETYYLNLESFKKDNSVKILNPLSSDLNVLRQTLLFGGLEAIQRNENRKNHDLKFYENGNCYCYLPEKADGTLNAYKEETRLAIFICGNYQNASWSHKGLQSNFFHLKLVVENILNRLGIDISRLKIEDTPKDIFEDGYSLLNRKEPILNMGIVSKKLCKSFDITSEIYFAEIRWDALVAFAKQNKVSYSELPRFPEVRRDLALVLDKDVEYSSLRDLAFRTEKNLLKHVDLFDIYKGDKLPENKKQYAMSFILQDEEKTLTDVQIEKIMNNLLHNFEKEVGAVLR